MVKLTFLFIIVGWFLLKDRKNGKKRYLIICAILFFIMMAFRNEVIYGDTFGYVQNFHKLFYLPWSDVLDEYHKDPVFYLFSKGVALISNDIYTVWFFIIATLYMIPLYILLKRYSVNHMFAFLAFILLTFMLFSMAGLRQTIAFGFTMFALIALMDKRLWLFIIFVGCGALFHKTALVFLILYPISLIKINRTVLLVYLILFVSMFFIGKAVLTEIVLFVGDDDSRFQQYLVSMKGSNYTYIIQQAIVVLICLYSLRNEFGNRIIRVLIHSALIGLIFISLSPEIAEMFRVSMYFSIADILLLSIAMSQEPVKKSGLPLAFGGLLIVYLTVINGSGWLDYYFCFEDTSALIQKIDNVWL